MDARWPMSIEPLWASLRVLREFYARVNVFCHGTKMDEDFARALDSLHYTVDTTTKMTPLENVPVVESWARPVEPKEPKKDSWLLWIILLTGLGLLGYAAYIMWTPKNTKQPLLDPLFPVMHVPDVHKDDVIEQPVESVTKAVDSKPADLLDASQLDYLASLRPALETIQDSQPKIPEPPKMPEIVLPDRIDGFSVQGPYPFVEEPDEDTFDRPMTEAEIDALVKAREAQTEQFGVQP